MSTLILDATTKTIKAVMSGAASTTNPTFTSHYADNNGTTFTEGSSDGAFNGTTDVTLVSAPSSGYRRTIKDLTIYNADSASVTISIKYDNNGIQRTIAKVTLLAGERWTPEVSFDEYGKIKTQVGTGSGGTPGGSNTEVQFNDGGSFGGDAGLTYNKTTDVLTVAGSFNGPHNGTVGATTANTGAFTTLSATGNVTLSGGTANGVAYLNGSKVLTTGSALTFDGTNLGIGTSSPGERLNVVGGGATTSTLNVTGGAAANDNATVASDYSLVFQVDANNNIGGREYNWRYGGKGYSDGTLLMTLNASGNLGLGVAPSAWPGASVSYNAFQFGVSSVTNVANNAAEFSYNQYIDSGGTRRYISSNVATRYRMDSGHSWYTAASGTAGNAISFTQAMTLDASGNLLVGTTSPASNSGPSMVTKVGAADETFIRINHDSGASSGGWFMGFSYNGTAIGSITQNGTTAVAYNTSSDYRLKNITGPVSNSGAYIDALKPCEGTWKADGSTFVGLIAHEAQAVSRTPVATGTKDGEQIQGMDYSNSEFIANIIAELQSLRARVAALESN
jgi:hypothetical protein